VFVILNIVAYIFKHFSLRVGIKIDAKQKERKEEEIRLLSFLRRDARVGLSRGN